MLPPAKRRLKQKNDADTFEAPNYNEQPIDFQALASVNSEFRDCLASNNGRLDFKNPEHLRYVLQTSPVDRSSLFVQVLD